MPDESVREFTDRAHAIILDIEGTTTSIDFVKVRYFTKFFKYHSVTLLLAWQIESEIC